MHSSSGTKVIPYVAILVIACYLYYVATQIGTVGNGQLGADFWPKTILVLTIVTCVWKIAEYFYRLSRVNDAADREAIIADAEPKEKSEPAEAHNGISGWTPWIGIGTAAAYMLLLDKLGYFLSTLLFSAAFMYLGGYHRLAVVIPVAFVASLAFMFLFMKVVYVALPLGIDPFSDISTFLIGVMGIK